MFKNLSNLGVMACRQYCGNKFVQNGKKILGAGLNYNSLLKVLDKPAPPKPVIFLKPTTSYIEEGQNIVIPPGFTVNEEIELGVVIGKKCFNISEKEALDYVSGYCIALDMTATSELTEARANGGPWSIGKGFDTACPVSQFITKEEIPDPGNVSLWLTINGEKKQDGNTNDLTFSVPALISFISKYMTLEENDLILTGSPPGMGPVKSGDVIEGGIPDVCTIKFNVK